MVWANVLGKTLTSFALTFILGIIHNSIPLIRIDFHFFQGCFQAYLNHQTWMSQKKGVRFGWVEHTFVSFIELVIDI